MKKTVVSEHSNEDGSLTAVVSNEGDRYSVECYVEGHWFCSSNSLRRDKMEDYAEDFVLGV